MTEYFRTEAEKHLFALQKLFEKMPDKGEVSQKTYLLDRLESLRRSVEATDYRDLVE